VLILKKKRRELVDREKRGEFETFTKWKRVRMRRHDRKTMLWKQKKGLVGKKHGGNLLGVYSMKKK